MPSDTHSSVAPFIGLKLVLLMVLTRCSLDAHSAGLEIVLLSKHSSCLGHVENCVIDKMAFGSVVFAQLYCI